MTTTAPPPLTPAPATWAGIPQRGVNVNLPNRVPTPAPAPLSSPSTAHLIEMYNECVARGVWVKLVLEAKGGSESDTLHCSSSAAATAAGSRRQGRKRPANERRKERQRLRWRAWKEKKGYLTPPNAATAAAEDSTSETVDSTAAPAAERAASAAKKVVATAAVTPQRAWVWEPRDRLLVVARRLQEDHLESPETARGPACVSDFNISLSSSPEEREPVEVCSRRDSSPPPYAGAATRAATDPSAADPGLETSGESAPAAEERMEMEERAVGVEQVFRPPPTPPPWSKYFSSHPRRVLCTFCYSGNREIWNVKCSDCYRIEREEFKKQRERNLKK